MPEEGEVLNEVRWYPSRGYRATGHSTVGETDYSSQGVLGAQIPVLVLHLVWRHLGIYSMEIILSHGSYNWTLYR